MKMLGINRKGLDMEEDYKELGMKKEYIQDVVVYNLNKFIDYCNKSHNFEYNYDFEQHKEVAEYIEKLIKAYKELEKRNKEFFKTCCKYEDTLEHYEYKIFDELDDYIKLDEISKLDKIGIKGKKYISESLIKEKIEELRNKLEELRDKFINNEEYTTEKWLFDQQIIIEKIAILEELLTPLKNV